MMVMFNLVKIFFCVGLFAFGGGTAMLPIIYQGVSVFGMSWLDFSDMVALSQITPGPIAVNAATYIGLQYAGIAGAIAPVFAPLGFGDWKICTALISGIMAKESVVSVLEILFSVQGGVSAVLSTASAASLLVFSLLYTPCIAAIASIKRELGTGWAAGVVVWQCTVAWVVASAVASALPSRRN